MHPDHMPRNSQRDGLGLVPTGEEQAVFDRIPALVDTKRRTAQFRNGFASDYQKAKKALTGYAAEKITRAADAGETKVVIDAAEANLPENISHCRLILDIHRDLEKVGYTIYLPELSLLPPKKITVSWSCSVPDYRRAEG